MGETEAEIDRQLRARHLRAERSRFFWLLVLRAWMLCGGDRAIMLKYIEARCASV